MIPPRRCTPSWDRRFDTLEPSEQFREPPDDSDEAERLKSEAALEIFEERKLWGEN